MEEIYIHGFLTIYQQVQHYAAFPCPGKVLSVVCIRPTKYAILVQISIIYRLDSTVQSSEGIFRLQTIRFVLLRRDLNQVIRRTDGAIVFKNFAQPIPQPPK